MNWCGETGKMGLPYRGTRERTPISAAAVSNSSSIRTIVRAQKFIDIASKVSWPLPIGIELTARYPLPPGEGEI
jgi:hypothetical protein